MQANVNPIQLPAEKNTLVLQEKIAKPKKKKSLTVLFTFIAVILKITPEEPNHVVMNEHA